MRVWQVRITKDAKLASAADVERGMRAVLNEMGTLREDLPELPKHVSCRPPALKTVVEER